MVVLGQKDRLPLQILSISQCVLTGLLVSLLVYVRFFHGNDKTVEVVGLGECADCQESNIKTSQAFSGSLHQHSEKKGVDPKTTQIHSWIEAVGGVRKNMIPGHPRLRPYDIYESDACPLWPRKGEGSSDRSALARIQDDMFMRVMDETLAQARANPEEYALTADEVRLLARDVVEGDF